MKDLAAKNMKRRTTLPLWAAIIVDILAAALLVGGWFAARIVRDSLRQEEPVVVAEHQTKASPAPSALPAPEAIEAPDETEEPEPDTRSEWQIRFAERFSDEVVRADDFYSGANLCVVVTHHEVEGEKGPVAYHLAEVWTGNIDCFRSGLAATPPRFHMSAQLLEMAGDQNAVVAVNGDFCSFSYGGVAVRNGVAWSKKRGSTDLCVLYRDGTMETVASQDFDLDAAIERDVWQVWSFGPALLNKDGSVRDIPRSSIPEIHITGRNPRTAIGYFEPGHYCFLVADGRQPGYSVGMTLEEMAQVFSELGCKAAYNLDGGGSSMMVFRGELVSRIYTNAPRSLSDCVLFCDYTPTEEESEMTETGDAPAEVKESEVAAP